MPQTIGPTEQYVFALADGKLLWGEYASSGATTESDAKEEAADYAREEYEENGEIVQMVLHRMVPFSVGTPIIIPGEDLGDGDREPDEFGGMEWT